MHKQTPVLEAIRTPFVEIHPPLDDEDAFFEATRCLECGGPNAPAPCTVACPTHIDIPQFLREIREGQPLEAARTIFEANPLGSTCARVCPVEVLCEGHCVLYEEGRRPVSIGRLQRYACDWAMERNQQVLPTAMEIKRPERIAIIGAGPAGLACAAELALMGYQAVIYDNRTLPGGLVTYGIAPYKQLVEPLPREVEELQKLGVEFHFGIEIGKDLTFEQLERDYEAIFIGVGLGEDQPAEVEGENLEGIYDSLNFVEILKLGDWHKLRKQVGNRVAVIGGGNTAIDVAREAVRLGAREVNVIYRRTEKDMPAYRHEYEAARQEGVHFLWLTAPKRFIGNGRVKAIDCIHLRMVDPDAGRRSALEPVPGSEFRVEVDSVIKAIGQQKRTAFLEQINGLELNRGLVKVNEDFQTTAPKYFAGGDCINGGDTVVQAVADGRQAARGIDRFLGEGVR